MQIFPIASALAAALVLAGCVSAPTQVQQAQLQALDVPAQWQRSDAAQGDAVSQGWWRSFGSAELDALVDDAQQRSLDVAAAMARVQQAQASARYAGAELLPTVNASALAGHQGRLGGHAETTGRNLSVGLAASYELDLWGRLQSQRDAAGAALRASSFDHDTVRLSVTAAVADAWLLNVGLRERGEIAQRNLQIAERLLALVESKASFGAATSLELAQQRGLVAAQRRALAALDQQQDDAQRSLALLLGQAQGPAVSQSSVLALQVPRIDQGQPIALVTRRPDIARAEARLQAADADLEAARAAMLPRLTLTAELGAQGRQLQRVLDNPLYALAAGLAAPIFDAGRLAANRDLVMAQREELLLAYRQSIVQAFSDVQTALNAVAGVQQQALAQEEELRQARRAMALAEARYRAGAETQLVLLDTQRSLYQAQDLAVQLQQERLRASVALYKALGGGWGQVQGEASKG
ncbi:MULTISPECIES: efflux transporter outer membrane subunit [Comamonas]|uniref:Efflux transporter outer membrane subunit n=1 Tax=Comamonas squillarum TaxID=2977320 RepID=A0ABY6A252_9BURK|nr:efflux transporter outer membrane subunit [Comamonas sp. PR12]UXC20263.1 efflux transporter outer membrane subunit [Comamonas sp. PR12]